MQENKTQMWDKIQYPAVGSRDVLKNNNISSSGSVVNEKSFLPGVYTMDKFWNIPTFVKLYYLKYI